MLWDKLSKSKVFNGLYFGNALEKPTEKHWILKIKREALQYDIEVSDAGKILKSFIFKIKPNPSPLWNDSPDDIAESLASKIISELQAIP